MLEMLIISCSTSSSVLSQQHHKDRWVLGKGTVLNVGLGVSYQCHQHLSLYSWQGPGSMKFVVSTQGVLLQEQDTELLVYK